MNAKEELMYLIIDNCIRYCTIGDDPNSKVYITREVNTPIYLNQYVTRKYVYEKMSNIWFEM